MINQVRTFQIVCDNGCGTRSDAIAADNIDQVARALPRGWISRMGNEYCPTCALIPAIDKRGQNAGTGR